MPPATLLQAVLGCDRLTDGWHDFYGVREARSKAITSPSTRKAGYSSDSFDNPKSETSITLFLLGNVDGWKQLDALPRKPRISGKKWNPKFFELLGATNPFASFARTSHWGQPTLSETLFGQDEVDYERLVLLFEVEAGGQSFRQVTAREGNGIELSFLKLGERTRWARFDAVLIDPTHRRLYLIEAKLGSDLSPETKKLPLINQAVRSLEAGYWLTNHPSSKYAVPGRKWSYRLVLLCPRPFWEYRLRLYAYALRTPDAVADMLDDYRRLLNDRHTADLRVTGNEFEKHFNQFATQSRHAVRVVYWDTLADAVAPAGTPFWDAYFREVEAAYTLARSAAEAPKAVEAVRDRLRTAGIMV